MSPHTLSHSGQRPQLGGVYDIKGYFWTVGSALMVSAAKSYTVQLVKNS